MAVSIHCASSFNPKWKCYIYRLVDPISNEIFYVGKTTDMINRMHVHLNDARKGYPNIQKCKKILSILELGIKPLMQEIESHEIRTNYDSMYYDYREFYFIRKYLEEGVNLLNSRVNDILSSELRYKEIISESKRGGKIGVSDFYYRTDEKGYPIYDLKKIKELGYSFSKKQFASHWAYQINLEKYANIEETVLVYAYDDIHDKNNYNPNWSDGLF